MYKKEYRINFMLTFDCYTSKYIGRLCAFTSSGSESTYASGQKYEIQRYRIGQLASCLRKETLVKYNIPISTVNGKCVHQQPCFCIFEYVSDACGSAAADFIFTTRPRRLAKAKLLFHQATPGDAIVRISYE